YQLTRSYFAGIVLAITMFYSPLFATYSVVGMQDMAQTFAMTCFVAAILQYCRTKRDNWLFIASLTAGLAIGVRATLILATPALAAAALLTIRFKKPRLYMKAL